MNELLSEVLEAHGGLERWRKFSTLSATIVTGGELWGFKGLVQDAEPRRTIVDLRREWGSLDPFGDPDWLTDFTPDRIAIVSRDGKTVAERSDPRAAFGGHTLTTPWDPLHRAYFNGYALWTYLTTPFVFAEPGFEVAEIAPVQEGDETWRGLRATFPDHIATHSRQQDFYFGRDGLLRRHDYHVDVAGGFAAAQLVSRFVEVRGLRFPTRRRAYQRGDDLRPKLDPLLVSIDLTDFVLR
jgi:hypothetical protein